MEQKGKLTITVGAQYGDECKGATTAQLVRIQKARLVVRAGVGPNAEHGMFVPHEGQLHYLKTNQLPLGWILSESTQIRISSGVAIDPIKLHSEIDRYNLKDRVRVSPASPIVERRHILYEEQSSRMRDGIGSTLSGSGPARADHIMRVAMIARDEVSLQPLLTDVSKEIDETLRRGDNVIIECSQGYGLRLSNHKEYPNVTSDDVTSAAALADAGISPFLLDDVVMCVKAVTTREGGGTMGNISELSLDEIKSRGFEEPSSIGDQQRRVAKGIDFDMIQEAARVNGATQISLTFAERHDPEVTGAKHVDQITSKTHALIAQVEKVTNAEVIMLNTGKPFDNMIYLANTSINIANDCRGVIFPKTWFDRQ